jgi:hypothetical protein
VLRTWRLAELPAVGARVTAELLGDHRLAYLDYEGPVSGGRGSVSRWDGGTYEVSEDGALMSGDRVTAHLHGQRLCGRLELVRDSGANWLGKLEAFG